MVRHPCTVILKRGGNLTVRTALLDGLQGLAAMRKKEHSGSAAVIGAQLVILFILTVSLCVQSRKAAAENTYAVMEESGEGSQAGASG